MEGEAGKVNGHGTEIIHTPPVTLAAPNDESPEQRLAKAEKQIAFRKGILRLIAANIEPSDVVLFGKEGEENVHLTKHACKQILSWAGITVQPDNNIIEKRYEGEEGPYMDFEVWATWFTPDGRYYRSMGNRATFDDFYAQRTKYVCPKCNAETSYEGGCPEHGKVRSIKRTAYLPLTEVDIPAIKQAAITNLWNHIVDDAGLKPSLRELKEVGFKFSQAGARVNFNKDSKQAPPDQKREASPKAEAAPPQSNTAASATPKQDNNGVPRANIPGDSTPKTEPEKKGRARKPQQLSTFGGYISQVWLNTKEKDGTNYRYVKLIQNGRTLLCFHDGPCVTRDGDLNLLDLIAKMKSRYCKFLVKATGQGSQTKFYIEGALQIGSYAWTEDGMPIKEPAMPPEGSSKDYQASDEDIPF